MDSLFLQDSSKCTGCGACVNACQYNAIQMQADNEGFLYPVIVKALCLECGRCKELCPICNDSILKKEVRVPLCYAAWSKDEGIRNKSSSGGIFSHLAMGVLERKGIVVGARYRDDNLVEHSIIHSEDEIEQLRGSKYVQSEIGYVFREVEKELKTGRLVLFSGTPCQCGGIKTYLGKEYDNLILCDFVCLGVNSPMVYMLYLREIERRYGAKVKKICFKSKEHEWNRCAIKIKFENGMEYVADKEEDAFLRGFAKATSCLYLRRSCYDCRFRGEKRFVDITLGDFWGIEKILPYVDTKKGVSLVNVHTEKGKWLFELCAEQLDTIKMKVEDTFSKNPRMLSNPLLCAERRVFFEQIKEKGFEKIIKRILDF